MCPKSSRTQNTWRHLAKLTGTYKVAKTGPTARDGNKIAFLAVTCWKAACWFRRLSWRGRCPSTTFPPRTSTSKLDCKLSEYFHLQTYCRREPRYGLYVHEDVTKQTNVEL